MERLEGRLHEALGGSLRRAGRQAFSVVWWWWFVRRAEGGGEW
jgi:hypothetical protein